ncbi:tetratricopeptide repeat protein, partial [Thermodesulfobacteriota bacterium]
PNDLGIKRHIRVIEYINQQNIEIETVIRYFKTIEYANKRQWDKALNECNKTIDINPMFAEGYLNRYIIYTRTGKYEEAISDFNKTIELNPDDPEIYGLASGIEINLAKGLWYGSQGKLKDAREAFEKSLEQKKWTNPDKHFLINSDIHLLIIEYVDQKKIEPYLAIHYFKTICKLEFNTGWYQPDRTQSSYDNQVNKYAQLISYYNEVVKQKPEDPAVYFIRAYIYENNSFPYEQTPNGYSMKIQRNKAIADYSKAIKLNPEFIDAYYRRGLLYKRKSYGFRDKYLFMAWYPKYSNSNKAIADFSKVIELNPGFIDAYLARIDSYIMYGKFNKSIISDLNKIIVMKPNEAEYYIMRAEAYVYLKKYKEAIADCTKAIELEPKRTSYYFARGLAYIYNHQDDKAISDFNILPLSHYDLGIRASIYANVGKYEEAVTDYSKIIETIETKNLPYYGDLTELYNGRGDAYKEIGKMEKACSDWRKARDLGDTNSWSIVKRMQCLGK